MGSSEESFEQFVHMQAGGLLRTACLITWDDDEAEDLVQECLLRVSKRWRSVRAMEMPVAYARRILINLALDGRNRRSRRLAELGRSSCDDRDPTQLLAERVDLNAEAKLHALGERYELRDALGHLTPQQRTVLAFRYFEDMPAAQVAELLGCSIGTVNSSASRGLTRLRELMAPPTSTTEVCES